MGDKKRHYLFPPGDPKKAERDFGVTDENRDALAERGRRAIAEFQAKKSSSEKR